MYCYKQQLYAITRDAGDIQLLIVYLNVSVRHFTHKGADTNYMLAGLSVRPYNWFVCILSKFLTKKLVLSSTPWALCTDRYLRQISYALDSVAKLA